MAKRKSKATPDICEVAKPSVYFNFSKGRKPNVPENFNDLKIGQEVVVSVVGKVQSLRVDEDSSSFNVTLEKVKVAIPKTRPKGMSDIMDDLEKARRK